MNDQFQTIFKTATANPGPFPFQREFATRRELYSLVNVPTGLGKTAMVVVGWLWRRFYANKNIQHQTPRRLVYCLPMRVLVEQTRDNAVLWLNNLGRLGGEAHFDASSGKERLVSYTPDWSDPLEVVMNF